MNNRPFPPQPAEVKVDASFSFGRLMPPPLCGQCKSCRFWLGDPIPCYELPTQTGGTTPVPKANMVKAGLLPPGNMKTCYLGMCCYFPNWTARSHDAFCGCHQTATAEQIEKRRKVISDEHWNA